MITNLLILLFDLVDIDIHSTNDERVNSFYKNYDLEVCFYKNYYHRYCFSKQLNDIINI